MTSPFNPRAVYDETTTEADVAACFRLLLGRAPNPEEWPGHSAWAGQPLPAVVATYLNSLEFARRRLLTPKAGAVPEVAHYEGFRIYAGADDLAVGRHVLAGEYEPEVVAVFRDVLRPGMGVVDIGANIGFFTMLSACLVGPSGAVLAIEPNPANARQAEASRLLNQFAQVTVLQVAAGRGSGLLALNTSFSNGTTSALDEPSVLTADTVACVAVDRIVPRRPAVGLLKLDVEGAEFNALLGCQALIRRDHPVIVMEFSPAQLPGLSGVTGEHVLEWLIAQSYTLEVIAKDGPPVPVGRNAAAVMNAYVQRGTDHIDIIARPASAGFSRWARRLLPR